MEKIKYELPKKAQDIIEELAEAELNQVSFYLYLSYCCSNAGFYKAADHFMQQSKEERYHFLRLSDYLQSRGIEPEVPKVDAPKIDFTDLRSGVKAAYELEIEITEKYDECIKMLRDIDTMTYLKLCTYMEGQEYALSALEKMWTTFGAIEGIEEQREAENGFWGCKVEEAVPTSA